MSGDPATAVYQNNTHTVTKRDDQVIEMWGARSGSHSPIILTGGSTPARAKKVVDEIYNQRQHNVCVAFGRNYISTPGLLFRIKEGMELNPYRASRRYCRERKGNDST